MEKASDFLEVRVTEVREKLQDIQEKTQDFVEDVVDDITDFWNDLVKDEVDEAEPVMLVNVAETQQTQSSNTFVYLAGGLLAIAGFIAYKEQDKKSKSQKDKVDYFEVDEEYERV